MTCPGHTRSFEAPARRRRLPGTRFGLALFAAIQLAAPTSTRLPSHVLPLEQVWSVELASEPAAAPLLDSDRVIVALRDGSVVALSRADGTLIWTVTTDSPLTPVRHQDLVLALSGPEIRAIRVSDGSPAWRTAVGDSQAPPTAAGDWLIAGTKAGVIVALRVQDGTLIWRRPVSSPLAAAPAVEGERLYLPLADGRVAAWHIQRGEPIWERTLGGSPGSVLALGDRIFVGARDNFLYCLAPADGEVLWRWRTAADVVGLPSTDDRRVYFVSLDNVLRALDRRTGVQRWKQALPARHLGEPQVVAGVVMAAVPATRLSFFLADTGQPAATVDLAAPVAAGARLDVSRDGGHLFVTTVDEAGVARLIAFGPGSGPAMARLGDLPGAPLWPEVPLATKPLPVGLLVLPESPRRVW